MPHVYILMTQSVFKQEAILMAVFEWLYFAANTPLQLPKFDVDCGKVSLLNAPTPIGWGPHSVDGVELVLTHNDFAIAVMVVF